MTLLHGVSSHLIMSSSAKPSFPSTKTILPPPFLPFLHDDNDCTIFVPTVAHPSPAVAPGPAGAPSSPTVAPVSSTTADSFPTMTPTSSVTTFSSSTDPTPPLVTMPTHSMITRGKDGIRCPNPKYAHIATTSDISLVPKNVHTALKDLHWLASMQEEYGALVKPATIRLVLSLDGSHHWHVHQLDVKNAFLHGNLNETVYCQQPVGFIDPSKKDHICILNKSLYGLKQAPCAWYTRFAAYIQFVGFLPIIFNSSLFVLCQGDDLAYLLLYVDDIVLTTSSTQLLPKTISLLHREFSMKDIGPLHFFLGISVERSSAGFFLSQQKYAEELLDHASMASCKPATTAIDTSPKLSTASGTLLPDSSLY